MLLHLVISTQRFTNVIKNSRGVLLNNFTFDIPQYRVKTRIVEMLTIY